MLKTLRVVCIYNPFEPMMNREEKVVYFEGEKSISECIKEYFEEMLYADNIYACYNGLVVDENFKITSNGLLTLTISPSGDNQSLRLIAAAVIMVASVATGQIYGAELGGAMFSGSVSSGAMTAQTAGHIGAALITTAVSSAGMMLLNSVLPVETPKAQKSGSRNYSFSGSSNNASDGDVLPELIGTVRFAPPLVGAYRSLDGDTSAVQYINLLYALGDISDGVRILLNSNDTESPMFGGPKIFINNAEQSQVTVSGVVASLEYDPSKNLSDYDQFSSINTYFNNTVHEVEIGKTVPLDRHLDATNTMTSVAVNKNLTHNGYQYASFDSATIDPGGGISAPTTIYTTAQNNVSEVGINFSFVTDKSIIDRVDILDIEVPIYGDGGVPTGQTKTIRSNVSQIAWMCSFMYRKNGEAWSSRPLAIFSPQWNGTNEIDGGLWYEQSGMIHPDDEIGELSSETTFVYGDQFSYSVKLPSNDTWQYGVVCTGVKIWADGGHSRDIQYLGGVVSGQNIDFCCIDGFVESTPDAMESFDIDGTYDINEITVVMYFPNGLISYNSKNGNSQRLNIKVNVGIRRGTDGVWIEKIVDITRQTRTPFRHAIHFPVDMFKNSGSTSDHYYIRAYYVGDYTNKNHIATCMIDYVQLSKLEPMVYPGVAMLAMKIKASQKISGRPPVIEVIAKKDDYHITYDGVTHLKPSSNPAWACVYRLQRFGIKEDSIRWSAFEDWASFCDVNGLECNHYIDSEMTLSDTLEFIGRCGRGSVIRRGILYDVIIDKPTEATQMFTEGNIIEGSFIQNFIPEEDLANVVCVWYSEINVQSGQSKRRAIEVRANNITSAEDVKRIEVEYLGCTSKDLAKKYAISLLNQTISVRKTIEFVASVDAITCEVGDVILVSRKSSLWTVASGRTTKVRDTYFEIDTPIVHDPDYSQYVIKIRRNSVPGLQVDSIFSMTVTPEIPADQSKPFIRFNNSTDLNPTNLEDPDSNEFIYSLGATRISDNATLDAKKFRVMNISRESSQFFKIIASEYNAEMYNDDYIINEIITPTIQRKYIANLKGVANFSYDGKPYVTLTWTGKSPVFYVFYKSEGAWIKFSEANDTICNVRGINFTPDETYTFSVSTTDNPYTGATCEVLIPEDHIPLNPGEKDVLSDADYLAITGLEIVGQGNDTEWKERDLKIRWNEIVYDFETNIDKPEEGAATTNIDMKELRKFKVCLYDDCGTLIKDYIVYEPHFELSFEDNKKLFAERTVNPITGCVEDTPPPPPPPPQA